MPRGIYTRTEEHNRKISASHRGLKKPWTGERNKKNTGKKQSPESIAKRAAKLIGNKSRTGQRQSPEERLKKSLALRGSKSWRWKGGITSENLKIRGSLEYKLWRESVFKRDNWACIFCKSVGGRLNADHIKPFAYYPELRFAIDNGRTLCVACHRKTDTWGGRVSGIPK